MKVKSKGFIKELATPVAKDMHDPKFGYPKAVVRPQEVKSHAFTARAKAQKPVKPDSSTNLVSEQTTALKKHKGDR